ncbi:MAG: hypothetical protein U0572_08960 [Phycisphaerales bacterium]
MHRTRRLRSSLAPAALWLAGPVGFVAPWSSPASAATTWHVDDSAPPGGDGTSWSSSFVSLQAALAAATAGDEIKVAQGTYAPTAGNDRTATFAMKPAVAVRGGFRGAFAGPGNPDDRNSASFPSILSGEIGAAGSSDNSFHVVTFIECVPAPTLDGCTVTSGAANGAAATDKLGGGIRIVGGSANVVGCTIKGNAAASEGCGLYGENAIVALSGCVISNHSGATLGTGVRLKGAVASIDGCAFTSNTMMSSGTGGGGLCVDDGSVSVVGCTFLANAAPDGGAMRVVNGESHLVRDCSFMSNSALKHGGAIAATAPLRVVTTTFQSNSITNPGAGNGGGAIAVFTPTEPIVAPALRVARCVFLGNTATTATSPSPIGGGIWCQGTAIVTSSRFLGNSGQNGGGCAVVGGGSLRAASCEFSGNVATARGGAVSADDSTVYLTNCTLSRNSATLAGGGLALVAGAVVSRIENSIFWLNSVGASTNYAAQLSDAALGTPFITYSTIQGASAASGIEVNSLDPMFTSPLGADAIAGTLDDDLTLASGSSAIDAGANAAMSGDIADADFDGDTSEFLPLDAGGHPRFADDRFATDEGCGFAAIVDRGAQEHAGGGLAPTRGDANGDGAVTGADLAALLAAWGPCDPCCEADVVRSGWIDASDLLTLIGELWSH